MTGTIFGIKRMEMHDGDGIRTTVFFKGCPLKCIWCHNPEGISFQKQVALFQNKCIGCGTCGGNTDERTARICPADAQILYGTEYDAQSLAQILYQDKPYFDNSGGGVTFSGGECLMQASFAVELAKELKKMGIDVYIDTCGYVKQAALEQIIPYAQKFLYDIKAVNSDVHKACTGQDNGIILKNLKFLIDQKCDVEIRYPLVVGWNHREADPIGVFLSRLNFTGKIKVLQYHNFAGSKYDALGMENTLPDATTTLDDMDRAVAILKDYGLDAINGAKED